jgi:hypothetical protein
VIRDYVGNYKTVEGTEATIYMTYCFDENIPYKPWYDWSGAPPTEYAVVFGKTVVRKGHKPPLQYTTHSEIICYANPVADPKERDAIIEDHLNRYIRLYNMTDAENPPKLDTGVKTKGGATDIETKTRDVTAKDAAKAANSDNSGDCELFKKMTNNIPSSEKKNFEHNKILNCMVNMLKDAGVDASILEGIEVADSQGLISHVIDRVADMSVDKGMTGLMDSCIDIASEARVDLTNTLVDGAIKSCNLGNPEMLSSCLNGIDVSSVLPNPEGLVKNCLTAKSVESFIRNGDPSTFIPNIQELTNINTSTLLSTSIIDLASDNAGLLTTVGKAAWDGLGNAVDLVSNWMMTDNLVIENLVDAPSAESVKMNNKALEMSKDPNAARLKASTMPTINLDTMSSTPDYMLA